MDADRVVEDVKPHAGEKGSGNKRERKRNRDENYGKRGNYTLDKRADTNEDLFRYYKLQGLIPEGEWQQYVDTLKVPLPSSFRIQLCLPERDQILKYMQENFFAHLEQLQEKPENEDVRVPEPIPFVPYAFQATMPRATMRSHPVLRDLHEFLVNETEIGNMSRQEAVSMVPPLLLDIEHHHVILDACAAPGSKTMQIIELMHEKNPNPEGLVVANDIDYNRCYLLVHQTLKRLPTANCVVINQDASMIPAMLDGERKPILFDRILCDVICSGDGTMRKNPELWSNWDTSKSYNLHKVQQNIARRCLQLLAVGGLMVYSTCSLNPIEDEAVLAYMLRSFKGKLELVDVSDKLPTLKRSPGVSTWKVVDKSMQPIDSFEVLNQSKARSNIVQSMFPPTDEEAKEMHLERSFRILPHAQNSGGFFVAVLRKTGAFDEELKVDQQQLARPKQKKRKTFREDPFVFLGEDSKTEFGIALSKHYGVDPVVFPCENLLIRTHNTEKKNGIYFVNDRLREFLKHNDDRFKVVNAGMGVLRKVEKVSPCGFRLMQDGLRIMIPYIKKRVIDMGEEDMVAVLQGFEDDHYISLDKLSNRGAFDQLECGSVVLRCSKGTFHKDICAWMGQRTVSAFISREEKIHCLTMLGADTSKLRKHVISVRQGKAAGGRLKNTKGAEEQEHIVEEKGQEGEELKEEVVDEGEPDERENIGSEC